MSIVTVCERRVCADCLEVFSITSAEMEWFLARGLQPPRRCAPCRRDRRERENGEDVRAVDRDRRAARR